MAEDGKYRGYGRAVDIWSIGCVVLEMSTGRRPWPDMHPFQITMKVCQGVLPAYPNPIRWILKHFLDSCFVFNPDDRKSAEQLLHDPFADVHVDADSVIPSLIAQDDNDGENKPLSWQTSNQGDNIDNHGSGSRGSGSSGCNSSSS
nr:Serine threonine protein kinase-related domain containing protein [Haemonchus contortus]